LHKRYKILLSLFFSLLILLAFTPPLNPTAGGWTQQFMPNLNGRSITDIFFLDSLTGWGVTNATNQATDTTFVLKTTNSGDNWVIQYRKIQTGGGFPGLYRVYFINPNTGYICGITGLNKSTDGGVSWFSLNAPLNNYLDMSVLNENTIWLASPNSFSGGVYRTTNGGLNWDHQFSGGNQNPNKVYMYNARIGFMSNSSASPNIYKTTNSGENWSVNVSGENFTDMHFVDSLIGWKCTNSSSQAGTLKQTTDGGLNWMIQNLPPESPPFSYSRMFKFTFVNKDTIWGIGGVYTFNNGQSRGVIYKTTNGGFNWSYQIPDTSINIYIYNSIQFVNKKNGWAYSPSLGGVHTTTGGDTITSIQPISNEIPDAFELRQNFPNPFNPVTNIIYALKTTAFVVLKVHDITGKEIIILVNRKQRPGTYQSIFDGSNLSSGIYFCTILIVNEKGGEVYRETKKAILIK
jgi:photosystem II stability/assembly factor-like uncharacterized protein